MEAVLWRWLVFALAVTRAVGVTVSPANFTDATSSLENEDNIKLSISQGSVMALEYTVAALTSKAQSDLPPAPLSGPVFLATPENEASFDADQIVIISCDPYAGELSATDVFEEATSKDVRAILFYTSAADYCNMEDYSGSYSWIYSMKSEKDAGKMLEAVTTPNTTSSDQVWATIGDESSVDGVNGTKNGSGAPGGPASSNSKKNGNPLGPSPTTAVAMIILYSITGIITCLFLAVIITGALRAHRHPERYGPRGGFGQPRQSRAKGLARALLDTLPIVKFGEREEPKPTDVELADAPAPQTDAATGGESDPEIQSAERQPSNDTQPETAESGIAAAVVGDGSSKPNSLGCSICTEDFETGQDQRVLPCDHRFHPECVDPWLLNVSGTCPLCRIDLRPGSSRTAGDGERDDDGNPVLQEGEFEPPPLGAQGTDGEQRRMSIRRSIALGIMGIGRPDRMTREERVLALRQLRGQRLARQQREEQAAVVETPEEERRTSRRLRNVLGIRTRRTEQQAEQAPNETDETETREESNEGRSS